MPISEHFQLQLIRSGGVDCTAVFSIMDIFKSQLNLSKSTQLQQMYKEKRIHCASHKSHQNQMHDQILPKIRKMKIMNP